MLAALLTPPGRGAIAVIHLVGPGALELARRLIGRDVSERPTVGKLEDAGEVLDEVVARRAPGFTGEETVEISSHGGTAPVERILKALAAHGAPAVTAAELLERGLATGHLDRIRVEAHLLLPEARTELAARVLQDQAEGALSGAVKVMEGPWDADILLKTSALGRALATPRKVVIAGSPNVGKSTLFNALVEHDRVIVSPVPGTTRDPVREVIAIEQVPFELVDTAGVEPPRDPLERLAIDRTQKAVKEADVILFLFDAEAGARGDELTFLEQLGHRRLILLANKADAGKKKPLLEAFPISAKSGQGLDEVRRRVLHALELKPAYGPGAAVVFTDRQHALLRELAANRLTLEAARKALLASA